MPEVQQLATGVIQALRAQEDARQDRHEEQAKKIIGEIDTSRKTLEQEVSKLADLSVRLRAHALRERSDLTSGYIAYASAHTRICGALGQGLRRTASMNRVLDSAKAAQEETRLRTAREEEGRQARVRRREVETLSLPTSDDFDLLYGDDESKTVT